MDLVAGARIETLIHQIQDHLVCQKRLFFIGNSTGTALMYDHESPFDARALIEGALLCLNDGSLKTRSARTFCVKELSQGEVDISYLFPSSERVISELGEYNFYAGYLYTPDLLCDPTLIYSQNFCQSIGLVKTVLGQAYDFLLEDIMGCDGASELGEVERIHFVKLILSCHTNVGTFYIGKSSDGFHPIYADESLGCYATAAQAIEDLANNSTFSVLHPRTGKMLDTSQLGIPEDSGDWEEVEG